MKQFQIIVSIPPEEVVRRLSSAIQKPGLGLAVSFGAKISSAQSPALHFNSGTAAVDRGTGSRPAHRIVGIV